MRVELVSTKRGVVGSVVLDGDTARPEDEFASRLVENLYVPEPGNPKRQLTPMDGAEYLQALPYAITGGYLRARVVENTPMSIQLADWEEAKHPRGKGGKFAKKAGAGKALQMVSGAVAVAPGEIPYSEADLHGEIHPVKFDAGVMMSLKGHTEFYVEDGAGNPAQLKRKMSGYLDTIKDVPPEYRNRLKRLIAAKRHDPYEVDIQKAYGYKPGTAAVEAVTDVNKGTMVFWHGASNPGTFSHEFGHLVDKDLKTGGAGHFSLTPRYDQATIKDMEAYKDIYREWESHADLFSIAGEMPAAVEFNQDAGSVNFPTPGSRGVTGYGRSSPTEDFAEAWAMYRSSKKGVPVMTLTTYGGSKRKYFFKDIWPNRAAFFDKYVMPDKDPSYTPREQETQMELDRQAHDAERDLNRMSL